MVHLSTEQKYFTRLEALEDILEVLEGGYDSDWDELHNEVFNTDYYIIGTWQAKQALNEYGVFEAIAEIKEFEELHFGEVSTDLSDPEKVANMLYYIVGYNTMLDLEQDGVSLEEMIEQVKELIEKEEA